MPDLGDIDKLGERQRICLQSLRRHGHWPGGWLWDNASGTKRILDSLVKKGFATVDEKGVYRPVSS
jgi:hypothetical protein